MPQIKSITTTTFDLPLKYELKWGKSHKLSSLKHVLVKVTLNDRSIGFAEATPRPTIYGETPESITSIIKSEVLPRIKNMFLESKEDIKTIYNKMGEIKNNQTAKGAVDMALHHALAIYKGQTMAEYLEISSKKVKVSYILGLGKTEEIIKEVEEIFNRGVRVFKIKIGRDIKEDIKFIQNLKKIFGDKLELYADANECLNTTTAYKVLLELEESGILYCEEPLPIELVKERASLAKKLKLQIIADDSAFSQRDLTRELELNTFDILNIKTARTGYTESLGMLKTVLENKKGVMVGSQASSGTGTVKAAYFSGLDGVTYPCELSAFLKLKDDIVNSQIRIVDGYINLDELDSVQIDEKKLKKYSS